MYASFNARAVGLERSAAETIDLAVEAGFEGVDLMVRDLLDAGDDPRSLRARMDDLGLRGGAFPNPVDWRGDDATFATGMARLPRLAEAAAILGLSRTSTWVLPETPGRPDSAEARHAHHASVLRMHQTIGDKPLSPSPSEGRETFGVKLQGRTTLLGRVFRS